jgi:hypothetical protein
MKVTMEYEEYEEMRDKIEKMEKVLEADDKIFSMCQIGFGRYHEVLTKPEIVMRTIKTMTVKQFKKHKRS